MICINLKNTDPFFCLATEEYLLKNFSEDIFMLWQSDKTIVVGKHQNALGEINYPFVRENNITVARRISGGGTVYHDSGNVNFSFIKNVKSPAEISFKQFTEPVRIALAELGIEATTSGRNDLLIEGLKISGNAEHVYKKRVLHHGTLLFDSDLENLGQSIKVVPGKYESRAVQSNRSKVANIASFLRKDMSVNDFVDFLIEVQLKNTENRSYVLSSIDDSVIQKLVAEKFTTWDWQFGYSPKYTFKNEVELDRKMIAVRLQVKKGRVEDCVLSGDYFPQAEAFRIVGELIGKRHFFEDVKAVLNTNSEELVNAFF